LRRARSPLQFGTEQQRFARLCPATFQSDR